jgi:hypothetical protein
MLIFKRPCLPIDLDSPVNAKQTLGFNQECSDDYQAENAQFEINNKATQGRVGALD